MADIHIANHRILSDTHGWMIAEEREHQKGKKKGEVYLANKRYAPNLQSALLLLQDEWLRTSDADSVEALLDEIRSFRAELAGAFAITVVEPRRGE